MKLPSLSSCILWLLFFLQTIQLSLSLSLPGGGNETDRLALLAFKDQISADPLGILSSWNESLHFCEWSGVVCGRRHQRVVKLDLYSCQLVGKLSPHVGNLSFLRTLNLENNSFGHNIPQELGHLFRLQQLFLSNNSFSGEIPVNVSRCSNLLSLRLEGNNLTGKLPAELGSLSKLRVLVFRINKVIGEIPITFGNLSSIEIIHGAANKLQSIPNTIGQLKKLRYFILSGNDLSGMIPDSMYNLSSLTYLAVQINQLHGSLPPDLGLTLPNLEIFKVYSNQFRGLIPATISNASSLSVIDLGSNGFTGKLPTLVSLPNLRNLLVDDNDLGNAEQDDLSFLYTLTNKTGLEFLGMDGNNLGGLLPEIVSNFSTKLRIATFGRNQIQGSIPVDIGNLISLDTLGLEKNQLTGVIPSSIGKLRNLAVLALSINNISGVIPSSLGNITSLINLYLDQNNLQGSIPSTFGNCQNLLSLDLHQNNLSGSIPKEVIGISSLSIYLDLSGNYLTDSLPSDVGKLVNLGNLSVSDNGLSGEIPRSLGSCVSLEFLYLGGNFFQGPIPESMSSLKALQALNLSHNNLTGKIPKFLGDLRLLRSLDLSFNDLEGEVPVQGIFANASVFSILGNKKLCGGIPQLNLSRCTSKKSTKLKTSTKLILIIAIPCGFLGVVLMISYLLFVFLKKRKDKPTSGSSWEISSRRVAYKDLLQATNGFSPANLIGSGSFGSVYKGILDSEGAAVAVKVFNLLQKGASKSFMAECAVLINIRHRNVVKVLTACSSIDFEGNDFKALVYEFMINGSLEEWLHPVHISDEENKPRKLNLIQRLNIAIDVASALDYLHCQCEIPIVHCDLKPSNVLLDGDMTAHVGDFGLARFFSEAAPQLSSNQSSSVGLKGTIGYAAPEYGMGSEVSTYGDVYSYGILLLEMFTGKKPTDGMFKDGMNLHIFAKMALPKCVADMLDPLLLREDDETSGYALLNRVNNNGADRILECLNSIINVGVACSVESPSKRMDISNVVAELHETRDILNGNRMHGRHEVIAASEGAHLM